MHKLARGVVLAAVASLVTVGPVRAAEDLHPISSHITLVKTDILFKFVSNAGTFFLTTPGGSHDPTIAGGSLSFLDSHNPAGTIVTINLNAPGWKGLGTNPVGSKGWKYHGAGTAGDPCSVVLVKAPVIKAVCHGTDIEMGNNEPPIVHGLRIRLNLGVLGDRTSYCILFSDSTGV